jgi:hypothetical protein
VQGLVADREALALRGVAGTYLNEEAFTGAEDAARLGLLHLRDCRDAAERCEHPHVDRHLDYEGWGHFHEGRQAIETAFAGAANEVGSILR